VHGPSRSPPVPQRPRPLVVLHYNGSKWTKLAEGNFGVDVVAVLLKHS